ncbi:MAG: sigma-54-dependent Fis family transcriptional regulator, partial [Gemmatimonadetes bacterium]|nr:sigma-54-dependent Fis family transcriptional regulator [Gemmatimonadota bacterium]
ALAAVVRRRPDAVITDLRMPGLSGLDLLARLKELDDELPVVVMTAFGTVETAVAAMKGGAYDFVPKPFDGDHLILTVRRAIEHARVVRENAVLRRGGAGASGGTGMSGVQGGGGPTGIDRIVGDSPAIRRVKEQVLAVASSSGTVLICGESGTGKEVVARAVHELSPRATGAFLAVNCAALSESL